MTVNSEIKQAIKRANIKKWQVANCLGIADTTFSRWLRFELGLDEKGKVLAAVEQAKEKFKGE